MAVKSYKNRDRLRKHTELQPETKNNIRWLATCNMLEKYVRIRGANLQIDDPDGCIRKLSLSPDENYDCVDLSKDLVTIKYVTIALQDPEMNLGTCRDAFDIFRNDYEDLDDNLDAEDETVDIAGGMNGLQIKGLFI